MTLLEKKIIKYSNFRILQKCFIAIKTTLPCEEIYNFIENNKRDYFPLVRVLCDIEQISKRFIAIKKRSLVYIIEKFNRKYITLMKKEAKKNISFRLFKYNLNFEITKRLTVEQRIISESFESRGEELLCSFFLHFLTSFCFFFLSFISIQSSF